MGTLARKQTNPDIYFLVSLCECAIVRYNGTKVYFAKRGIFSERNVNSCRRDNRFILRVPFTNWRKRRAGKEKAIGAHNEITVPLYNVQVLLFSLISACVKQ